MKQNEKQITSSNSKFLNSEERLFGTDGIRGRVNEDKINDLCTTWQAEAEKAAELLPNMTSTIESTRNAFDAYKTERLTGMKTNIVDKFSNDIAAARASYAINAESKDQ